VVLSAPVEAEIPLAFALSGQTDYRWTLRYRLPPGSAARVLHRRASGDVAEYALPVEDDWRETSIVVRTEDRPDVSAWRVRVLHGRLQVRGLRLRRGMQSPWDSQFVFYLRQLVRLDFGTSLQTHQKVTTVLKQGVVPSLSLTLPIFSGGLLISILLSLLCACFRDRLTDRLLVVLATALMSVNYIIWVVAGQYFFAYRLGWFPIWGYESWRYLCLPVAIGIVSGLGRDLRFYRTVMLDEMYKDYVRTARAKGVRTPRLLFRHVLRNALIPVVTNVSMALPFLFTGSLLLESFFGSPGLGGISINAIHSADMDVVRATVLIGALLYVLVNLLTDVCYAAIDPRVRLS
jgi:peptide/nickel transport system permease protein